MLFKANIWLMGVLLVLPQFLFAQKDTIQEIGTIQVSVSNLLIKKSTKKSNSFLTENDIRELAVQDVGELLTKLAGINLKSYGGLGGLKTVDVRAMGSQHTVANVDGFTLTNNQTGQVNFGQIQADNIVGVAVSTGGSSSMLMSVSSQIAGSSIVLQSFENVFSNDSLQLRTNFKYGSFNQMDSYLAVKYSRQKYFVSGFGKFRQAEGKYAYSFKNGNNWEESIRSNNDYQDYYAGATVGFRPSNKFNARIGYRQSAIDQGLPGAVILYNQTADERLTTSDLVVFGDASLNFENLKMRIYGNANRNELNYIDPTYLNSAGKIDVAYTNNLICGGITFYQYSFKKLVVHGGFEQTVSDLVSSDTLFSQPLRSHSYGLLGVYYPFSFGRIAIQFSGQYVNENNRFAESANDQFSVNPFIEYQTNLSEKYQIRHKIWYKNSFRMPTFNELYFNNIGNIDLLPETAHQVNYSFEIVPFKKLNFYLRSNLFFNRVENKILAIPTKNLFVWSMQNVSNVQIYGGEVIYSFIWKKVKNWEIRSDGNYTYQKSIDVTSGSLNYGDQIAYTPEHLANLDVSVAFKKLGIRFSNNFASMRYSLNENIVQNEVEGFLTSDVSAFYSYKMKKRSEVRLQFTVKNVFDQSYAYVRSFVMPGRNYLISLSYAFN